MCQTVLPGGAGSVAFDHQQHQSLDDRNTMYSGPPLDVGGGNDAIASSTTINSNNGAMGLSYNNGNGSLLAPQLGPPALVFGGVVGQSSGAGQQGPALAHPPSVATMERGSGGGSVLRGLTGAPLCSNPTMPRIVAVGNSASGTIGPASILGGAHHRGGLENASPYARDQSMVAGVPSRPLGQQNNPNVASSSYCMSVDGLMMASRSSAGGYMAAHHGQRTAEAQLGGLNSINRGAPAGYPMVGMGEVHAAAQCGDFGANSTTGIGIANVAGQHGRIVGAEGAFVGAHHQQLQNGGPAMFNGGEMDINGSTGSLMDYQDSNGAVGFNNNIDVAAPLGATLPPQYPQIKMESLDFEGRVLYEQEGDYNDNEEEAEDYEGGASGAEEAEEAVGFMSDEGAERLQRWGDGGGGAVDEVGV